MTKEDAEKIKQVALQRIREAANDGSIIGVKDLAVVLFRWRDMTGRSSREVKLFCYAALEDDQSVVSFARAFLGQSYVRVRCETGESFAHWGIPPGIEM